MTHQAAHLCAHPSTQVATQRTPFARHAPPSGRSQRLSARAWAVLCTCVLALGMGMAAQALAADTSATAQLQRWRAEAKAPASADKGKAFFNTKHGGEWSCASCHNAPPTTEGKHANTGKVIGALAPAFNPKAFTDEAKVDKWFRRNCNDVLKRECSPPEKADVLAYLLTLKP